MRFAAANTGEGDGPDKLERYLDWTGFRDLTRNRPSCHDENRRWRR